MAPSESLLTRILGEYGEMPGLRLTVAQAGRVWRLDATTCHAVLNVLADEGFLTRTRDGAFVATGAANRRSQLPVP